jgi:hypothetical protein
LFEFDIEETISLENFSKITGVDPSNFEQCRAFFDEHTLVKLRCIQEENFKSWQRQAYEYLMLIDNQKSNEDKTNCLTIGMNTTRGKFLFPQDQTKNHQIVLFLVSQTSEGVNVYLDSDFAVVYFNVECAEETPTQPDIQQDQHFSIDTEDFKSTESMVTMRQENEELKRERE